MVFCGKPSKGCHACRARKSRCDANPNGCGQCLRAGRVCPGYRQELDLMFRDESSNVVKKAKARESKKKALAADPTNVSSPSTGRSSPADAGLDGEVISSDYDFDEQWGALVPSDSLTRILFPPTPYPALSTEEKALAYFVSNYVINVNGPVRGHLDQVGEFYRSTKIDDHIFSSVKAVGLAGYAYSVGSPELLVEARRTYAKALRLTNEALRSPVDSKKDSTASAIVILGIFEMVTGVNPKSLDAWAQHINGASALLKLRGYEQLKTSTGCRILGQITASLVISCLQYGWYIPEHIIDLFAEAARTQRLGDPSWKVQQLMIEVVNLWASIKDGTLSSPQLAMDSLLEMDERIEAFIQNAPLGWEFETITSTLPSEKLYKNTFHFYCDYWVAHMFNLLRAARVMFHEHIRRILLKGFSSIPPAFTDAQHIMQFQVSSSTILKESEDILYTVPQHLGHVSQKSLYEAVRPGPPGLISPISKAAGGYFLLFPICMAGSSDVATAEMRDYTVRTLDYIGHAMGIQLSLALGKVIRDEVTIERSGKDDFHT